MAFRRFLFIPSVVRNSLVDNDGYVEFCNLVETLNSIGETSFWYVVVPTWVKDGLKPFDNIQYVYSDSVRDVRINQTVGFPAFEIARDFARRGGRLVVDGVLTNCVGFAAYLRYLLSDPQAQWKVPVFLRDHGYAMDVFKDDQVDWFVLASNFLCSNVAVRSKAERAVLATFLKNHASPSTSKLFIDRSINWPVGHKTVFDPRLEPDGKPVMFCGGEYDNPHARKGDELLVAQRIFAGGHADVVLTTRTAQYMAKDALPKGDRSFLKMFRAGVSRDEYDSALKGGDFFVSILSKYYPLDVEEEIRRLLFGQVGVFPYCGLAREVLGERYPFYYNHSDLDEATAMASWVADNIVEAREMIDEHVEVVGSLSNIKKTSLSMWNGVINEVDSLYTIHRIRGTGSDKRKPVILTVNEVASKLGERFAFDVIVDILEEHIPWLKPWNRKGTLKTYGDVMANLPTMFDLREMLDNLGWGDMCDGPEVFFEKTKEPAKELVEYL